LQFSSSWAIDSQNPGEVLVFGKLLKTGETLPWIQDWDPMKRLQNKEILITRHEQIDFARQGRRQDQVVILIPTDRSE
jgi:hypothetical protein